MKRLLPVLLLWSAVSFAQGEPLSPPPLPPVEGAPAPAAELPPGQANPSYWQRCFAIPGQVWIPTTHGRYAYIPGAASTSAPVSSFHSAQPVKAKSAGASGGGSGGGGSIGDGKGLLIVAVVVVAVLPVIVYAVDVDAPAVVEGRFQCPTFGFDAVGGVDLGRSFGAAGSGGGRFTFGYSYFGADFQFDLSNGSVNAWSSHLLLRIKPRAHIEPNLALGFRSLSLGGRTRAGLELGVPHRYVFWREGLRQLSLELRPTLLFGLGSVDAGLEAAVVIPLVEPLHLRVGGKLLSFGEELIGGFNAGLTFTL